MNTCRAVIKDMFTFGSSRSCVLLLWSASWSCAASETDWRPLPSRLAATHHNKEQKQAAGRKRLECREGEILHNADIHVIGEEYSPLLLLLVCHESRLNVVRTGHRARGARTTKVCSLVAGENHEQRGPDPLASIPSHLKSTTFHLH